VRPPAMCSATARTLSNELETRTSALQALTSQLGSTQSQVNRLLGERQQSFEALTTTLNTRVEDIEFAHAPILLGADRGTA